jgi:hypothetical protein
MSKYVVEGVSHAFFTDDDDVRIEGHPPFG